MKVLIIVVVIVAVLVVVGLAMALKIVKQYEQGVLFRLGRVRDAALARHRGGGSPAS